MSKIDLELLQKDFEENGGRKTFSQVVDLFHNMDLNPGDYLVITPFKDNLIKNIKHLDGFLNIFIKQEKNDLLRAYINGSVYNLHIHTTQQRGFKIPEHRIFEID